MIELMQRLIERGHAYAADGDVYFDVRSFPDYGELSGQRLDNMRPPATARATAGKRDPRDFALWKARQARRAVVGRPRGAAGRPGWHLECSAMAAQVPGRRRSTSTAAGSTWSSRTTRTRSRSRNAAGDGFARYWLHNAWVTIGGEKMSKSLGNSLLVSEIVKRVAADRAALLPRRRALPLDIEYTEDALREAASAYRADRGLRAARRRDGSATTSSRAADGAARVRRGDGRRPGRPAGAGRRARHGARRATRRSPPDDKAAAAARARRGARHARRARARPARPSRGPATAAAARTCTRRRRRARRAGARAARRRPAPARTSRRPTPSATSSTAAGVAIEDTPTGPRWTLGRGRRPWPAAANARRPRA